MAHDTAQLRKDIVFETHVAGQLYVFVSTWGLFSPTEMDAGSRLLLEHVEVRPTDIALDIGCGYGAIGVPLAKRASSGKVHMIDKDFVAIEYSQKNARQNVAKNVSVYLSNGFRQVDGQFDLIVSNLPAKVGKEFFWILLEDARAHLKPGGRFYVVTISGLKEFIKRNFMETFGNYKKVKQGENYTVALAVKP